MSNKVQEFLNERFGEVRALKESEIIWFVAKDIATTLNYATTQKVTQKVDDEDIISMSKSQLTNLGNWEQTGGKDVLLINEGGLYQVIASVTKKDTERYNFSRDFKRWITNEVIPTIRNTGGYVEDEREEEFVSKYFPSFSEEVKLSMVQDLLKSNKELKTKAGKWDKFLGTDSTYTFTDVSKLISTMSNEEKSDIEISSSKLTEFLRDSGILCKTKTPDKIKDGKVKKGSYKNLPNKEYEEYFDVISVKANGFNKVQTRVKSKGVEFIYETLKNSYNKAV